MIQKPEERPWGNFTILDEGKGYKVKRLVVNAEQRTSYQYHAHRHEHWVVVAGQALVTVNGKDHPLQMGQMIDIPIAVKHRLFNPGNTPLTIIEVQRGTYLGEDDIVRIEDDFGRA